MTSRGVVATIIVAAGTMAVIAAAPAARDPVPIAGGRFEASGVVHVPGSNQLLFVDDGRNREIFAIELGADGRQVGSARAIPLGADVVDLEGITSDGRSFYAVGSQSKKGGPEGDGLIRFRYDPAARRISGVERVRGLKGWLEANVPGLRASGRSRGNALNIEGLAWDPTHSRLLLGLRAPIVSGQALVVAVKLIDPAGAFASSNLRMDGPVMQVDLGGAGIRSLEYDERARAFRIIAGASDDSENRDFQLREWDGNGSTAPRVIRSFDPRHKPEGFAGATIGGNPVSVLVFDIGSFEVIR